MTENVLNKTQYTVLDLLANALFDAKRPIDAESVDWSTVWYEAYMQAVSLTAFSKIPKSVYDFFDFTKIRKQLNHTLSDSIAISKEHVLLNEVLTKAEIPFMIIKGLASAAYYPDALLRSMGDVDFWVEEKHFNKAERVLLDNGFKIVKKRHVCHFVFEKSGCRYEMHFEPAGIPAGKVGKVIRSCFANAFINAQKVQTDFGELIVPSDFYHGLVILLHTCHHLTGEGIGLRHLCDWAVFVSSFKDDEFIAVFEDKLKQFGLWNFAQLLTLTCEKYLGCPHKAWAGEINSELTDKIIHDIFSSGNFGQKNVDRSHERLLISSRAKGGIDKTSMFKQFIVSLNEIVYNRWPVSRKIKLILPLGWAFYAGRYLLRSFFGKRPKIRIFNIAREAKERKNIYKEFHLFE